MNPDRLDLPPAVAVATIAVGLCALLVVVIGRWRSSAAVALILLGLIAGAASTGLRVWSRDSSPIAALARQHAAVTVALVVSDDPRPVSRRPAYGPPQVLLRARVLQLTTAGPHDRRRGRAAGAGERSTLGSAAAQLAAHGQWVACRPSRRRPHRGGAIGPRPAGRRRSALTGFSVPPAPCEPACGRRPVACR